VSSFHAIMTSLCFRLRMHYVFLFVDFVWVHPFGGCKLGFLRKGSFLVIPQTSLISSMLLHTEQVTKITFSFVHFSKKIFKIGKLSLQLHTFFIVILFELFKLNLQRFVIIHIKRSRSINTTSGFIAWNKFSFSCLNYPTHFMLKPI